MKIKKILLISYMSLFMVFSAIAAESTGIESVELVKTDASWNGGILPAYPEGEPEVTILKITVQPGVKLPLHMHPVINAAYMLEGEITVVTAEGDTFTARAGDAFVEVTDTWHYGVNEGDTPVVLIVFYAGARDLPITVKK